MAHLIRKANTAADIAAAIEAGIAAGQWPAGSLLPTVRTLAADLGVSPGTVASAYRSLRTRGLVETAGRRGTCVTGGPPVAQAAGFHLPAGVIDLASGSPDPALLPPLEPVLGKLRIRRRLYGAEPALPELLELVGAGFAADGVEPLHLAVVSGAMDGLERVLQAHLRPGDAVAVEDPGYPSVFHVSRALGLRLTPVSVDERGMIPDALASALQSPSSPSAVVLTPRAQNPTGATLDASRAAELSGVLANSSAVLVVEDDHAGAVSGGPAVTVAGAGRDRWAVLRSVSKSLGPDLRLAVVAGDEVTVRRVLSRQYSASGWVSSILQHAVVKILRDRTTPGLLGRAAATYGERRRALVGELEAHGIVAAGRSGLNVWIPVSAEQPVVSGMLELRYAVRPGEAFRLRSGPGIRITVSSLSAADIPAVASALAAALAPSPATRLA